MSKWNIARRGVVLLVIALLAQFPGMGTNGSGGTRGPDEEPPVLAVDNTPWETETGGELTFSVNVTDNSSVAEVRVNYTYGGPEYYNLSMNRTVGDTWNQTINVSIHAVFINYTFFARDGSDNTNSSDTEQITIMDTVKPVADAGEDTETGTYDLVPLEGINSTDNIAVVFFEWSWWCPTCAIWKYATGPFVLIEPNEDDFNVTLNVTDAAGNWDTDIVNITVTDNDEPFADAGTDIMIDQHETVYFNAWRSNDNIGIVNWTWEFEYDGRDVVLYGERVNFTFHTAGSYRVTLHVVDAENNSGPLSWDDIYVEVLDITYPEVDAGQEYIETDQYAPLMLDGRNSTDNVGIAKYKWRIHFLGKDVVMFGPVVNYTFTEAGSYNVTLEVRDHRGNTATTLIRIKVRDTTKPWVVADSDREVPVGERVVLDGSGSSDNVGIVNYSWNFEYGGAEHFLYGRVAQFLFSIIGTFNITLSVADEEGNTRNVSFLIRVVDKSGPSVDAGEDRTVAAGERITLDGSNTTDHSPLRYYNWTFEYNGTEVKLNGEKTSYTFYIPGTYRILLSVTDIRGYTGRDSVRIKVLDVIPPVADAGEDQYAESGDTVELNATASDDIGIANYTWSFFYGGEVRFLYGKDVAFIFEEAGNYSVNLSVIDGGGNPANDTLFVNVSERVEEEADDEDDEEEVDDEDEGGGGIETGEDDVGSAGRINILIVTGIILLFILIVIVLYNRVRNEQDAGMEKRGRDEGIYGEDGGITEELEIEETHHEPIEVPEVITGDIGAEEGGKEDEMSGTVEEGVEEEKDEWDEIIKELESEEAREEEEISAFNREETGVEVGAEEGEGAGDVEEEEGAGDVEDMTDRDGIIEDLDSEERDGEDEPIDDDIPLLLPIN